MKLEDGKYLKIEWDSNTLKVVDKKYMDRYMAKMLKEGLEIDFENGCGIVESLKINKVNEKDWKKVLEGYKKWELKEMGENSEWVEEEMDKESLEFLKKNKIKWNLD